MATDDDNESTGSEDSELAGDDDGQISLPSADEDTDEAEKQPEQRQTRDEKRRNRVKDFETRAVEAERRAQEAAERAARLEGALSTVAQRGGQPGHQPGGQADPLQSEFDSISDQQERLAQQIEALAQAKALTPELQAQYRKEARELHLRSQRVAARMEAREMSRNAPPPEVQTQQAARMQLEAEYGDVYGNASALQWAKGRAEQIIARRGPPANPVAQLAIIREALNEAAAEFGLRRETPSNAQKARYGSVGRGAGGTGGNNEQKTGRTLPIAPQRAQKMADAMYPKVKDPKVRLSMWKKSVGNELADELAKGE